MFFLLLILAVAYIVVRLVERSQALIASRDIPSPRAHSPCTMARAPP